MSCKRFYQQEYLDEGSVVIKEEEHARGQRTLKNIKTYNFKFAIYNFTIHVNRCEDDNSFKLIENINVR